MAYHRSANNNASHIWDVFNPAQFFTRHYYERSGKAIPELLAIGIHTVRIAEKLNTTGIRGVDAWVYESGLLRELTPAELAPFAAMSESLDGTILTEFQNAALSR
jgi:hypothetical protein